MHVRNSMPNAHINYTALTHQLYTRYVPYIVHAVQCTCSTMYMYVPCLPHYITEYLYFSRTQGRHLSLSGSTFQHMHVGFCLTGTRMAFSKFGVPLHVDEVSRTCTQCCTVTPVTVHSLRWKVASVARQNYYTWPNYASLSLAIPILWDMHTRRMPTYGYYRTLSFSLHSKHCIYALGQPLHVQSIV